MENTTASKQFVILFSKKALLSTVHCRQAARKKFVVGHRLRSPTRKARPPVRQTGSSRIQNLFAEFQTGADSPASLLSIRAMNSNAFWATRTIFGIYRVYTATIETSIWRIRHTNIMAVSHESHVGTAAFAHLPNARAIQLGRGSVSSLN